jgi:hypothetical protein
MRYPPNIIVHRLFANTASGAKCQGVRAKPPKLLAVLGDVEIS